MVSNIVRKRKNSFILILSIILAIILFCFAYVNFYDKPLKVSKYPAGIEVSNKIGFDLNGSAIMFGRSVPGSTVKREINVENQYDFPVRLEILASENLSDFVFIDKEIIINPNQTVSFPIKAYIPLNYSFGVYSGEIIINFKRIKD